MKTLVWGYLILFFWCAVIIIAALLTNTDQELRKLALATGMDGFKVVIGAAVGSFSTLVATLKPSVDEANTAKPKS